MLYSSCYILMGCTFCDVFHRVIYFRVICFCIFFCCIKIISLSVIASSGIYFADF